MDSRVQAFNVFKAKLMELTTVSSTLKTPAIENKFISGVRIKNTVFPDKEYTYIEYLKNISLQLKKSKQ